MYEAGVLLGPWWDLRALGPDRVGEIKNRPGTLKIVLYDLRLILQSVTNRAEKRCYCASNAFQRIRDI